MDNEGWYGMSPRDLDLLGFMYDLDKDPVVYLWNLKEKKKTQKTTEQIAAEEAAALFEWNVNHYQEGLEDHAAPEPESKNNHNEDVDLTCYERLDD